jgi:putative ABC transport system permease protein
VLLAALRDLQWRRRRVAITVVGTGLVFAMTLVLAGLSASFRVEAEDFVDSLGADAFAYSDRASGPFNGALPVAESLAEGVEAMPGVVAAAPLVFAQAPLQGASVPQANVIGVAPGGIGSPVPASGRPIERSGELVVGTKLDADPGESVVVAGESFVVVGTLDSTALAGTPNIYMSIGDVQRLLLGGQPLAMSIVVAGEPTGPVADLALASPADAVDNLMQPLEDAEGAITFISILLWIVAGIIIGSVVYLSALERTRDFAVFKATGASNSAILLGLAVQAATIALCAALLGMGLATLIAPSFPMQVVILPSMYVLLPGIAVVVGLLASAAGMRRVSTVDPAAAFGGP